MSQYSDLSEESFVTVQQEEQYAVEAIRSHKIVGEKTYYLVKWLDYTQAQNTWEPEQNLITVDRMVSDYLERRKMFRKGGSKQSVSAPMEPTEKVEEQSDPVIERKSELKSAQKVSSSHKNRQRKRSLSNDKTKKVHESRQQNPSSEEERNVKKSQVPEKSAKNVEKIEKINPKPKPKQAKQPQVKKTEIKQSLPSAQTTATSVQAPARSSNSDNIRSHSLLNQSNVSHKKVKRAEAPKISNRIQMSFEGHSFKQTRVRADSGTQAPEKQNINRVNHFVIKNGQILYEVEYKRGASKRIVNLLPSSVVMQENPLVIVEFFERNLKGQSEEYIVQ